MLKYKRFALRLVATALVLAPLSAHAGIFDDALGLVSRLAGPAEKPAAPVVEAVPEAERPALSIGRSFHARAAAAVELEMPSLPSVAVAELPTPTVETPLHRLFCVEYARARSGLAVFGDAKYWWDRAKNLYARAARPVSDAVMVFSGSKRLKRGHVAVVTHIVSSREIRVDQANWENHGEIDHATPVLDVSRNNDWSQVRVWDMRSQTFGAHVYAISGFIAKNLEQRADAQ